MSEPIKLIGRPTESPVSYQQQQIAERQYEEETPSFGESFAAATKLDTLAGVTYTNSLEGTDVKPDPNFVPDQKQLDTWMDQIRPEHYDELLGATSAGHGSGIVRRLKAEYEAEEVLGHSAANGVGFRLLAAVSDPFAWAAMAATEGLAAPWVFASKANRVQKAVRGAITAGAGNAALETYLYSQSSVKDPTDIMFAAVIGGALGGVITPFIGRNHTGAAGNVHAGTVGDSVVDVLKKEQTKEAAHVANKTEDPRPKSTESDEVPVTGEQPRTEPTSAWDNAKVAARTESDAWDELDAHTTTLDRQADELGELKDTRYATELTLEWVKDTINRLKAAREGNGPKVKLSEIDDPALKEVLDSAEGTAIKDEFLAALEKGTEDDFRLQLRERLKQIKKDQARLSTDLRGLDSRTASLQARYAAAKAANQGADSFGADSVGAARIADEGQDRALIDTEDAFETMEHVQQDTSKLGKARIDIIGRLLRSPNAFTRNIASRLSLDAVGRFDHSVAGQTAEEIANHIRELSQLNFYRQYGIQFAQWMTKQNMPWYARFQPAIRRAFNEEVSDAMRGIGNASDEAKKVGENASEIMWDMVQQANKAGVKGFEDISKFDPRTYFPRFIDKAGVRKLDAEFGTSKIEELVALGIRRGIPEMDDAKVQVLARAYVKRLRKLEAGLESNFARAFSKENSDLVLEILDEGNVPKDVSEGIMVSLNKANERLEGGRIGRAKSRLDMDEGVSIPMKSRQTGETREVSIKELFDNDAENVFNIYARQMTGQVGLARMGFRSKAEFAKWMDYAKDEAVSLGGDATNSINKEVELMEFMYQAISGAPLERDPASWMAQSGRFLRDWNFLRIMNQVGFAQLAEIGNIVGQAGFRATLTHVPEMRRMLKRIKETGELDDDLAAQLEAIIPIGTDRLRNQVNTRYDSSSYEGRPASGFFARAENVQHHAKRVTADISLMAPINMVLHRMSLKAALQRLVDDAHGAGRQLSDKRMAFLGVSEEMRPRIHQLLREHTTLTDSTLVKSKKIRALNIETMMEADAEAANVLVDSLSRWSRTIIQQNEIGATHELMHSTLGKILTQFRSFMLTAYGKQLLHGLRMQDMETFSAFSSSMLFGGMAYGIQNTINSVGRDDQDEFLRDRLNPQAWALASFQRAGFASLIPAAVDSAWTMSFGTDPIFAYGRSTGLASDAFLGNPTVDLINKVSGAVGGGLKSATRRDYDFSQKNFRDMWGLVWFSNAMVARNVSELMAQNLPKQSTSDSFF